MIYMEVMINRHITPSVDEYRDCVNMRYGNACLTDDNNHDIAVEKLANCDESIFERRRHDQFTDHYFSPYNRKNDIRDGKIKSRYTPDSIADEKIEAIYYCVLPVVIAIKDQFERLSGQKADNRMDNERFRGFLKCLKVREIHDCLMTGNAGYQFTVPDSNFDGYISDAKTCCTTGKLSRRGLG